MLPIMKSELRWKAQLTFVADKAAIKQGMSESVGLKLIRLGDK